MPGGGPNLPIMSPNPYLLSRFTSNIPMPTLYAGDSVRKPKLSVIEVLLYNMAALLAGVAAGYDVRMSNVSPVHPTLLNDVPALKAPMDMDYPKIEGERRFSSNTYHGPGRHNRMALSSVAYVPSAAADPPILRRSEETVTQLTAAATTTTSHFYQQLPPPTPHQQQPSTISTTSGLGSNFTTNTSGLLSSSLGSSNTQPPTPSPRRKISVSSFTENLEYSERDGSSPPSRHFEGFRWGGGPPPIYAPSDYLRNGPSFSNDGGAYGAGAHRTGYFGSNYFPYRPEVNLAFERDCKSYPDYSYDYNHRLPNYYDYNYEKQAAASHTPPPRVPQMGVSAGHRRTPSNISNSSNINQGFTLEQDELLPEFCDYNNHNFNNAATTAMEFKQQQQPQHSLYRDATINVVPPPTKLELYKSSPKLSNLTAARNADVVSLHRMRDYENLPFTGSPAHKPIHYQQHQRNVYAKTAPATATTTPTHAKPKSPQPLLMQERPASLPFEQPQFGLGIKAGSKLRSSLKKYNLKTPNGSINATTNSASQQGTPANATPSDSLTSDDSSYLSAKEGSISSQQSRVRFSPEFFLDASSVGERNGSLTGNSGAHNNDFGNASRSSSISVINRRISRRHTSDMSASPSSSS